ncbi:MAG: DsrE family protein, partial [Spirochaetales bacterium]|nr:DsrE family protein [Spirochaetales bacterium]
DNPITSEKMVCMYSRNALREGWWEGITIIVWGATVQYLATDEKIQQRIKEISAQGVHVSVCRSCAEQLGVTDRIEELGVELKFWGASLTEILQSDRKLITI